jgi:hypothetical protein
VLFFCAKYRQEDNKMKTTTKLTFAAISVMAFRAHASAASFSCHKTTTNIEHAICEESRNPIIYKKVSV